MTDTATIDIKSVAKDILATIEREREREIIARRFGLYDRKETLEQIGELLGITRERVRQLEKAILIRLKINAEKDMPHVDSIEKEFIKHLSEMGRAARMSDLAKKVSEGGDRNQAHVAFLSTLAPALTVVDENDDFHHSVAIKEHHPESKHVKDRVTQIVKTIKDHGKPLTIDELHAKLTGYEHPVHVRAIASLSKHLASLKEQWGHIKWPLVNPRNIRDKIYVILQDSGKPMHFSEIASSIKDSDFKRRDVTTQAIHNELIKDKRFVLIGRGIYALKEWGYDRGTVSDIIAKVLKDNGQPMHREDIVREVLKSRLVKETTILLNLQSKPQFKRTAKATYTFAE